MILAGTSEYGACAKCGTPWKRVVERGGGTTGKGDWKGTTEFVHIRGMSKTPLKTELDKGDYYSKTLGWQPGCECHGRFIERKVIGTVVRRKDKGVDVNDRDHSKVSNRNGKDSISLDPNVQTEEVQEEKSKLEYVSKLSLEDHPIRPCIVLDPFMGSATTAVVATEHGRRCWGIELSEDYLNNNAIPRVRGAFLARPNVAHLAGAKQGTKAVESKKGVIFGKVAAKAQG
jgi:hypothetical protein